MDSKLVNKSFENIQSDLSMHVNNKYLFRKDQIRIYNGAYFDEKTNWSSKNMRRIHFTDCKFDYANLRSTGFTGSIFKNCDFSNEKLDFTIFDEGKFVNCNFYYCTLKGCSFCNCEFVNCTMNLLELDACFFTNSVFNNFTFINCNISDIIWENARFNQCNFDNVNLQKLNFEFTYFGDIHFNETTIPFASIPFVFGGMKYILKTQDKVYIKTAHPNYKDHRLSKMEYLDLLPALIEFYKETKNYFPLANLYLGLEMMSDGVSAIKTGLIFWFQFHNYKLMYYLCDLTNTYNISIAERKEIFAVIQKCNKKICEESSWEEQNQWNICQNKMRECLLSSQSIPYIELEFITSIKDNDYITLSNFMQTVDELLIPSNSYSSLEIRHNSPFDLLYTIFADEKTLFNFIVGTVSILGVCDQLYTNHIKDRIKNKSNKKLKEKDQNKIDNITQNIVNVQYNFYNCKIKNLDTNYFTKQSIGCVNPESSGSSQ